MFSNFKLGKIIGITIFICVSVGLIMLAESTYSGQRCKNLLIDIANETPTKLVGKAEIENILTDNFKNKIVGVKFKTLNLKQLENKILHNRLIKSAEIHRTVSGNLVVKVKEEKPIARIVALSNSGNFDGLYVGEEGKFFPLSKNYTARIVLLSGEYFIGKSSLKSKKDVNIIAFLKYIDSNEYLKANLTHIIIDKVQNVTFYPLIGNFKIEYGTLDNNNFEEKFQKLKILYSKIVPNNGWEKYKMISIKYKNQIVCQLADTLTKHN